MISMPSRSFSDCGCAAARPSALLLWRTAAIPLLLFGLLCFLLSSAQAQTQPPSTPGSCSISVSISPASPTLCVGQSQTFTATYNVTSGSASNPTYQWAVDGNTIDGATNSTYTTSFSTTGNHTVSCTITVSCSGGGSSSKTGTANVTVNADNLSISSASGSPNPATTCDTVTFTASANSNCGQVTYTWNFGDGSPTASGATVTHQYASAGTYTATVTASDGLNSTSKGVTETITAGSVPGAPGTPSVTNATPTSLTITWAAASGASSYNVYRNGTQIGTTSSTSYTDSGLSSNTQYCYSVAGVNSCGTGPQSGQGCGNTLCQGSITINSATATPSATVINQSITFSATATDTCSGNSMTYTWSFGDNSPNANGATVTHAYSNVGTYTATVTVSDGTTSQNASVTVIVSATYKTPAPGHPPGSGNEPGIAFSGLGSINTHTGNMLYTLPDPVPTRGWPLECDITLNSQGLEFTRPMGNATFTYDIHVMQDTVYEQPCQGVLHWLVVDGDGTRVDFGRASGNPTPTAGVFSQLSVGPVISGIVSGYTLSAAGPPGDVKSAGDFTYQFDGGGRLTSITDPAGNVQSLSYGAYGLSQVLDNSTNKTITFNWSGGAEPVIYSVVENGGMVTRTLNYTGSNLGLLLSKVTVTDSNNNILTSTEIDYNGNQIQAISRDVHLSPAPNASTMTFSYSYCASSMCNLMILANESDALGQTNINWAHNPDPGAVETILATNNKGGTFTYDFNSAGDLFREVNPDQAAYTFTYNSSHQLLSVSDGTNTFTLGYASNGLFNLFKDYYGSWNWSYGGSNNADPTNYSDPVEAADSVQELLGYSNSGSLQHVPTSYTDGDGHAWTFSVNNNGQLLGVTPPNGSPTKPGAITYDENSSSSTYGYPLSAVDGNGNKVTFDSYDPLGDLTSVTTYPDSNTHETTLLTYDALQRPTQVQLPDQHTVQYNYYGRFLNYVQDPAGSKAYFSFDPVSGLPTGVSGPLGWSIGMKYDGDRQLTQFTDGNGHHTLLGYTNAQQLRAISYPDSAVLAFIYNGQGLLSNAVNARNQQINIGYDFANRPFRIDFPTTGQDSLFFNRNNDDTLKSIADGVGTATYTYTPGGRLQSVVYDYSTSGLSAKQEIDYAYYPDGLPYTLTWKNGSTTVATWTYNWDYGGRLQSLSNSFGETTSWTYDGEDKLLTQTDANNLQLSLTWNNARDWPTSINYTLGNSALASFNLTYDQGNNTVGNLTGVSEQVQMMSASTTYGYDALYRLTAESRSGSNGGSHAYSYDLADNRTVQDSYTLTFDNANKIASLSSSVYGAGSVSYDADGNLTGLNWALPSGSFSYDALNQLTQQVYLIDGVGTNHSTVSYAYDAFGRRVRSQAGGNTPVFYIYSGGMLLGEIAQTGTVNTVNTWGADGLVSERLMSSARSLYYVFGPQGETRLLVDSNALVADSYLYTSYGAAVASTGVDYNPFQFGGQAGYYTETAIPLGTIYCHRRWYDSYLGRWLMRDPIGIAGGQNFYAYCANNPVNLLDPSGLRAMMYGGVPGMGSTGGVGAPPSWIANFVNRIGNWYMGGMGGISQAVDDGLMNGSTANFGSAYGNWETGQGSGWAVAGAGLWWGGNLLTSAFSLADGVGEERMAAKEGASLLEKAEAPMSRLVEDGPGCFVAGTLVQVVSQPGSELLLLGTVQLESKPIEQLSQNDVVVTRNPDTGQTEYKRVERTTVRRVHTVVTVQLADGSGQVVETITATPEHPFYVAGKGFVEAQKLGIGTQVVTRAGPPLVVKSVHKEISQKGYTVYNLVVEGDHTYFVGNTNGGVWVHNPDCYEGALNKALDWLEQRGFKAEEPVLSKGLAGTEAGVPIGMSTADGTVGFRVEWDPNNGAHINVFDYNAPKGLQKGPHFLFEGDAQHVQKIVRRFRR